MTEVSDWCSRQGAQFSQYRPTKAGEKHLFFFYRTKHFAGLVGVIILGFAVIAFV